ncbi:hypothetical protein V5799_016302 [Amblyomma americanum]|uniref:ADAM10 cysteine-rich domain-containing protein n=1 Tax=Amblyomma americanum TaxID=6943 RepID=A0AAQ4F5G9_AMBAM
MTPCANGSRVCVQGECSHSVCLKYGLRECALTGAHFTPQQLCLIACQEESGSCKPGCELSSPTARAALCGLQLPPGSPCNDLAGYCDVFLRCRAVDDEGPLTQLKRLFFGVRSMNAVRSFIVFSMPFSRPLRFFGCSRNAHNRKERRKVAVQERSWEPGLKLRAWAPVRGPCSALSPVDYCGKPPI